MVRISTWISILFPVAAAAVPAPGGAEMVFPGEEWEEAAPESAGVDPGRLAAAVEYLRSHSGPDGAEELVVVRDGRIKRPVRHPRVADGHRPPRAR